MRKINKFVLGSLACGIATCLALGSNKLSSASADSYDKARTLTQSEVNKLLYSDYKVTKKVDLYASNKRLTLYEINNTISYTNVDDYLGFSVVQDNNVDINITLSNTEVYGSSFAVSAGASVNVEASVDIGVCSIEAGVEASTELTLTETQEDSITQKITLTVKSTDRHGEYFLYSRNYVADYFVVCQNGTNFQVVRVKKQKGVTPRLALLLKKPTINSSTQTSCM